MKRMIGMGHEVGGLYYLDFSPTLPPQALQSSFTHFHSSLAILKHQVGSLGHISSF
jgi:hypothetical protein